MPPQRSMWDEVLTSKLSFPTYLPYLHVLCSVCVLSVCVCPFASPPQQTIQTDGNWILVSNRNLKKMRLVNGVLSPERVEHVPEPPCV